MSKAQLLQELATFSRDELDDIAERVDQLRAGEVSLVERVVIRDRLAHYQKNPADNSNLKTAQ